MSLPRSPSARRIQLLLLGLALPAALQLWHLSPVGAQAPAAPPPAAPAAAAGPGPAAAPAGAPGVFKDLQVLPKDISKPELKGIMKAMSKALGTDCDFCHKEPNMELDTPKKTIAREMMRMTNELNKKYRSTTNGKVTCSTCHRNERRPGEGPK